LGDIDSEVDARPGWVTADVFESAWAYHSFQYFREISPLSDRNFTCNSSPVIGVIGCFALIGGCWLYLASRNSSVRFCDKPGHPYCVEHKAELAAMERADKDWEDIFTSFEALCKEPNKGNAR
jgi:hypothetical protein